MKNKTLQESRADEATELQGRGKGININRNAASASLDPMPYQVGNSADAIQKE